MAFGPAHHRQSGLEGDVARSVHTNIGAEDSETALLIGQLRQSLSEASRPVVVLFTVVRGREGFVGDN